MSFLEDASKRIDKTIKTGNNWVLGSGPHDYQDGLWIHLTPIFFKTQMTLSRSGKSIRGDSTMSETFTFLAPVNIGFALSHSYERYDSIASRAANVYSKYERIMGELPKIGSNAWDILSGAWNKGVMSGGNPIGALTKVDNWSTDGVAFTRVDQPLVYKDTDNMRYQFEFELSAFKDPESEITIPIKSLMKYSCPVADDSLAKITPPYVFKIEAKSKKGGTPLLKVNYAALKTVSPTYREPYIKGHPSKANLVLEFVDIEPVYHQTFDEGEGVVKVTETGGREYTTGSKE
jgi:hypothetical protein